jgi:hypothetical protein
MRRQLLKIRVNMLRSFFRASSISLIKKKHFPNILGARINRGRKLRQDINYVHNSIVINASGQKQCCYTDIVHSSPFGYRVTCAVSESGVKRLPSSISFTDLCGFQGGNCWESLSCISDLPPSGDAEFARSFLRRINARHSEFDKITVAHVRGHG